jgi:GNAT superfamily N-acetyltransferase
MSESGGEALAPAVRRATERDLPAIEALVGEHVRGHPAEHERRDRDRFRQAYLGEQPVAHLFVAERGGTLIGMGQWMPIYDMFWGKFGGQGEWLFLREGMRGSGIATAIIAAMCADIVAFGAEFLRFQADDDEIGRLYRRVAMGGPPDWYYVSGAALRAFGALAGLPPREIVRRLPDPSLNRVD